jgi:chromosome segregation ATPase
MELTAVLSFVSLGLVLFAARAHQGRKEAQEGRHALYEELDSSKKKLDTTRKELGKTKESLTQRTKALEEVRSQSKKKERRESKAEQRRAQELQNAQQPQDKSLMQEEMKKLKTSLSAMEHQVTTLQKEVDVAHTQADEEAKARWGDEVGRLKNALSEAEATASDARHSLSQFKQETEEEKNRKAQYPTPLDLESLDKDVVNELARFFKKSAHYQRLYNVAQGQVKMAQDKALDIQRRYREVCRELAIVAGTSKDSENAVAAAEAIVEAVATDEQHEARFGDTNAATTANNVEVSNEANNAPDEAASTNA